MKRKLNSSEIILIIKETVKEKRLLEADLYAKNMFGDTGVTPRNSPPQPISPPSSFASNVKNTIKNVAKGVLGGVSRITGGPLGMIAIPSTSLNVGEPSGRDAARYERKKETVGPTGEKGDLETSKFSKEKTPQIVDRIPQKELVGADVGTELTKFNKNKPEYESGSKIKKNK